MASGKSKGIMICMIVVTLIPGAGFAGWDFRAGPIAGTYKSTGIDFWGVIVEMTSTDMNYLHARLHMPDGDIYTKLVDIDRDCFKDPDGTALCALLDGGLEPVRYSICLAPSADPRVVTKKCLEGRWN